MVCVLRGCLFRSASDLPQGWKDWFMSDTLTTSAFPNTNDYKLPRSIAGVRCKTDHLGLFSDDGLHLG